MVGCGQGWLGTTIEIVQPKTRQRCFPGDVGEIWINGQIDRSTGVIVGINASQRVEVSNSAVPGSKYVIACLVLNGPLAEPRGGIFMRYATLAFETSN